MFRLVCSPNLIAKTWPKNGMNLGRTITMDFAAHVQRKPKWIHMICRVAYSLSCANYLLNGSQTLAVLRPSWLIICWSSVRSFWGSVSSRSANVISKMLTNWGLACLSTLLGIAWGSAEGIQNRFWSLETLRFNWCSQHAKTSVVRCCLRLLVLWFKFWPAGVIM